MNLPTHSRTENKRFAAMAFPHLRVAIARERAPARGPLAVVMAQPGSTIEGESSLLGNTRIDEVSPEAQALGILPGFTMAAARARSSELAVRVVSARAVERTLACVAEAMLALGRSTAFCTADDMVFVDVTGCEHLHAGPGDPSGAHTLAVRLRACAASLGHPFVRVAIARGPRMAAAFARHARSSESDARAGMAQVDPDDEAFARLPITALGLDGSHLDWLGKLGLSTIADLQKLPPSELGPRLRDRAVMALLRGEDETPLTPYVPPSLPEESIELEYGIDSHESLLFVAKTLCDRLSARLAGRAQCIARTELVLALDRALLPEGEPPRTVLASNLSAPIRTSTELMAVLRARIEAHALSAPVLAVTLRATKLVAHELRARDLFTPEARAAIRLPPLVAELEAELGERQVGMLCLENRWNPSQRMRLVPFAKRPKERRDRERREEPERRGPRLETERRISRAIEPGRFLRQPLLYTSPNPEAPTFFLARNGLAEWWRGPSHAAYDELAVFDPELGMIWLVRDARTKQLSLWGYIAHV
ncbi:Y-family DNA polymerase [Pendulispora albinea]|uniref:DNA polymerase Y family protein n=1 Tax=Pendulispora albinea TaxID=2741071 RepID=A0ABZ2LNH5_9BACT